MNVAFTLHRGPSAHRGVRSFISRLPLVALVAILALGGGLANQTPASAQSGSLRIDPPAQTVAAGQSFTVKIIQAADVVTTGAQTNVKFDPALLQVTSVQVGPAYTDAIFLYGVEPDGSNASIEAAIAAGNASGVLRNLTTLLLPGTGSLPPGDAEFVTIGMTAVSGGNTALELVPTELFTNPDGSQVYRSPVEMIDEGGNKIPVSVQSGEVTVTGGGGGAPAPTAAAASASPVASATASPQVARVSNATATLSVSTGNQLLSVGGEGKVELKVKANVKITGAEVDLTYDKGIIEITKVEQGPSWKKATLVAGTGRQKMEEVLTDANSKGELKAVGVQLLTTGGTRSTASPSASPVGSPATSATPATTSGASPSSSRPTRSPSASGQAGGAEESLLVLTVKGLKNGETELKLKNAEILDENGDPVKVTAQGGEITVGEGGGGGGVGLPLLIVGGVLGIGAIGGAGFAVRSLRRRSL